MKQKKILTDKEFHARIKHRKKLFAEMKKGDIAAGIAFCKECLEMADIDDLPIDIREDMKVITGQIQSEILTF